jgi:PTH1 family peptidyl-tRNA hydrolase
MKLIVGLGNPGKEYEHTRHNCGFDVLDALASFFKVNFDKKQFKGEFVLTKFLGEDIALLKPLTYMNLSGESVQSFVQFYKIKTEDIIVVFDDLALEVGKIRLRKAGTAGSHNGMDSVINHLKTRDIKRLRVGIGQVPLHQSGADYVLSRFKDDEHVLSKDAIQKAVEAIIHYLKHDFDHAMNYFN